MLSTGEILGRLVAMVLPLGVADQLVIIFLQIMKEELHFQSINIPDSIFTLENHFLKSLFSKSKKHLSEVGFEPTPPIGDQNTRTLMQRKFDLSLAP